jgi:hypothetical protein
MEISRALSLSICDSIRAAIKRKQRLQKGFLDDEDEDEDQDVSGEPEDQLHLLRPADIHNQDKPGRIRALWEPKGDFEATNYVNKLSAAQLEEILVDLLLVGEFFSPSTVLALVTLFRKNIGALTFENFVLGHKYKFAHERTPLRLPSKVTDMYIQLYMYSAVFSLDYNKYHMLE